MVANINAIIWLQIEFAYFFDETLQLGEFMANDYIKLCTRGIGYTTRRTGRRQMHRQLQTGADPDRQ